MGTGSKLKMTHKIDLIRQGNQAFNAKDYKKARELFSAAGYKDGLIRLGDHYMYERRLPLLAYGYYKQANAKKQISDIHRRMVGAIAMWIGHDKLHPDFLESEMAAAAGASQAENSRCEEVTVDSNGMIPVLVDAELRKQAFKILGDSNNANNTKNA